MAAQRRGLAADYERWDRLELTDDEEEEGITSSAGRIAGLRAPSHPGRDAQQVLDREMAAHQMKKPVREMLPKGSRTEEELLEEQAQFLKRKTDGEVTPAATLAARKPPAAPAAAPAAGAGKPMSKFARERQRQRDASAAGAEAVPGAAGGDGAGSSGGSRGGHGRGTAAGAQSGDVRQRMPPPKLHGEPMSVVNMQIVEKSTADLRPLAPSLRTTPAPVARHRSGKASPGADKRGGGREGGGKPATWGEEDLVGAAAEDEDWVGRKGGGAEYRPALHLSSGGPAHDAGGASLEGQGGRRGGGDGAAGASLSAAGGGVAQRGAGTGDVGRGELQGLRVGARGGQDGGLPSKEEIHAQNKEMLGKMSKEQIEEMKKELESQIDSTLLQKIRPRALKRGGGGGVGGGGGGGAAIAHKSNHSASAGRDGGGPDCVVAAGGGTKSVSFAGSNSSSVGVEGDLQVPAWVAKELKEGGDLCHLPAPSEEDVAKMQWMGDVEEASDSDDDAGPDGQKEGQKAGAEADQARAKALRKLSKKKMEGLRFDFDGQLIPPSQKTVSSFEGLHHHGDDPTEAGYTIPELLRLSRSAFSGQRTLALQTLTAILQGITRAGPPAQLLLEFLLENHVVVLSRCALDDKNLSHIACAARLACALLTASYAALPLEGGEGGIDERLLGVGLGGASVKGGGGGVEGWGGGWDEMVEEEVEEEWADVLGVRGNDMVYFETPSQAREAVVREQERAEAKQQMHAHGLGGTKAGAAGADEEDGEEEDAAAVAKTDPVRGLLGMRLLVKIRALLGVVENPTVECVLLQLLLLVARHSPTAAAAVYNSPDLLDSLQSKYIEGDGGVGGGGLERAGDGSGKGGRGANATAKPAAERRNGREVYIPCGPECRARILVVRLLRTVLISSRDICLSLHRAGILEAAKQHLLLPFATAHETAPGDDNPVGAMSSGGPLTSVSGGLVLTPGQVRKWQAQQLCLAAEVVACWRASLEYGVGADSLADLSLQLQAFAGYIAGSTQAPLPLSCGGKVAGVKGAAADVHGERAAEVAATMALRLAQTALTAAAANRGITWNQMLPWLAVAQRVGDCMLHSPSLSLLLRGGEGENKMEHHGRAGGPGVRGMWVLAAAVDVKATYLMCLEGLVAKGATDLHAARRLACHVCTDLFARGNLSLPSEGSGSGDSSSRGGPRPNNGGEGRGDEGSQGGAEESLWGVVALRHLLGIALSSHGGAAAARGGREGEEAWEGVRVRGVQEVALAMVRLLRAAVQLLMLTDEDALVLRERELQRQRAEMEEAAEAQDDEAAASKGSAQSAPPRNNVAVLPLMDLYTAAQRWAALREGSIRDNSAGEGSNCTERDVVEGVRVINEMMKVVVDALPAATKCALRRVGKEQARDPAHGRSSTLLHVEMLSLAACYYGGTGGEGDRQQTELVKSAYALASGLGPGDETIVLRIVDGVLLPHLCSPSALSRALGRQEIFHLGGGDSAEAAQAVRDYYLHWLKRLLTTEGEGVLPLSVALWTHQHAAIHTLTRPLKSAYLPLPRDFLFLPLAIALKAANQEADAHLATPEFRRASTMALSIVLVLLLQHRASASCATASSPRAGNGDGLGLLLVGRGGKGGESIGGARGGAGEALFCKSASVYLLGSDVYLHDSVAAFLRSAFATLLPPSWQCISDRDSDGGSAGLGGDGSGGGGAVGLDLSKKSVADLQLGKLFAALASQFTQDSFGDVSLSQMLLLALQAHLPPEWRIEIWETLKPYYLNLLRASKEGPAGGMYLYLWPPESNLTMINNYRSSLASGHVTLDANPFLFHLAVYHLSHYIFSAGRAGGGCCGANERQVGGTGKLREAGRQVLRSLIQESAPSVYLAVCAYLAPSLSSPAAAGAGVGRDVVSDEWKAAVVELVKRMKGELTPAKVFVPFGRGEEGAEGGGSSSGSGGGGTEKARKERWELLVAECARDDEMFVKVRKDGGVLGEEAFLKMQRDRVC